MMLLNRPAVKFCLPFIFGIIVGWQFSFALWYLLGFLILIFLFAAISLIIFKESTKTLQLLIISLLFGLGLFKITIDAKYIPDNQVGRFIESRDLVSIEGIITDPPKEKNNNVQLVIGAEKVFTDKKVIKTYGGVLVTIGKDKLTERFTDSLTYGTRVQLFAQLVYPGTARNPGEFDLGNYLNINGIYARIFFENRNEIKIINKSGNPFLSAVVFPLRSSIGEKLDEFIGGEEAKFLKGIMIGDRSEIPYEVKETFVNAGVMHILAVSGLHVGLITLIILALLIAVRVPEKPRILITCFLLIFYIFLTGQSPSVVRATIMAVIMLSSIMFERKIDVYNSLAIAALIILFFDSKQLFHPGFQLSFAAVISIVSLYPKISSVQNILPQKIKASSAIKFIIGLFSVSTAAAIGTLPFTSFYFGKISVIGLAANLLIVPLTGLVLASGIVTVASAYIWQPLGEIFSEATKFGAGFLLNSVSFFGNRSFSYINSNFTICSGVVFYSVVGYLFSLRRGIILKRSLILILVALNIWIYYFIFFDMGNKLRVTFIDVGQGDAIFLQFPGGKNMLVDAGSRTVYRDAGARFIVPFFLKDGIKKIDLIVNSHPHHDHLGGIPFILRNIQVDRIIDAGSYEKTEIFNECKRLIDSLQIPKRKVGMGDTILISENTRVYILHPFGQFDSTDTKDLNNQSIVTKITYGRTSLLLTGDAEIKSETEIVSRYGDFLQADILKIGHHGSKTSTGESFLENINPEQAVISVGYLNKFNHPSGEVLERLRDQGINIYRTDLSGAVVFESDGYEWKQVEWR
ncbi:MAG: DNA internalization-related competence protein ComEC/Rec2 [Bacteroidetes bacterium]|nr:DNA internalization-related competence protein ComEC/Rec2 [Bacteroidota bacterium]